MGRKIKWTEEALRSEAYKYDTKVGFQKGSKAAYSACYRRFPHLLDELFENQLRSWDEESLREEASKYGTKNEFNIGSKGAYLACCRRFPHLLDELFENVYGQWDEGRVRKEASKYDTKAGFCRGSRAAYSACKRTFPHLLDELFENQYRYTSNDVAYLWKSSNNWWKFGITSLRCGKYRIQKVSASANTEVEEVYMWHMDNALAYEKPMKDLGERLPPSDKFDGHTECRYLFDYEVDLAIQLGDSMGERIEVQ